MCRASDTAYRPAVKNKKHLLRPDVRVAGGSRLEAPNRELRQFFEPALQSDSYLTTPHRSRPGVGRSVCRRPSQHVETLDIPGTFPNRVQRHVAIESRQWRFFNISVTAQAFERLSNYSDRAFRNPIFADGGGDAAEAALRFITRRFIKASCQP